MSLKATSKSGANRKWGSDVIAEMLRHFGLKHVAINPGASFRGIHDSIVNYLGDENPALLLTLHEAQAVAIAHGYAKVTGQPLAVILHSNVGMMNAIMSIYNAWCDRVPMLIIGATGAVDAALRRPWIEWIHTSRDQGALIRNFTKWDDQPASIEAAVESMFRAWQMTRTQPSAPVYVCMDVTLQEGLVGTQIQLPDLARFAPPEPVRPSETTLNEAEQLIRAASQPLMLVGRVARQQAAWDQRITFAERIGAAVLCDFKTGVGFPSEHPLFVGAPAQYLTDAAKQALVESDLVINLDWSDLDGMLRHCKRRPKVIQISPDQSLHNGWALDHFGFPPADLRLALSPEQAVSALLDKLTTHRPVRTSLPSEQHPPRHVQTDIVSDQKVTLPLLAAAFDHVRGNRPISLTRLPFGWPEHMTRFTGPLDGLGYDGGGGIGSTPGITVGAALALKGSGRLPVAIIGDGDLLMGSQALWSAARYRLPELFIVNNNRAFYNDVEHQEVVARQRGRDVERKYIGMEIDDPAVDLCGLARSYGLTVFGPLETAGQLVPALEDAFNAAESGSTVLVDVSVMPSAIMK